MSPLRPDHFQYVRDMVHRRAGIVLEDGKEYLVETRLSALGRAHGIDLETVVERARQTPDGPMDDEIVDAMTTNETSFFRDVHPFNTLREHIIPRLIESRRATRTLRILSGAASTGQEAYSLAMMIRESFPELTGWDVRILGTDISREALARARAGRYSQLEVNRGLPAPMLRWFHQHGREFVIDDAIRAMVDFRELNLVAPWPPLPVHDVVLLRNVLIYFDTPTKQAILERIRRVLAPDGLLFLGASETTLGVDPTYTSIRLGASTVYAPDAARSETWTSRTMISAS
jgi:chemotaxis protein methyltransferase CheR